MDGDLIWDWTSSFGEDGKVQYTRSLLGAEFVHEAAQLLQDGLGEPCMGVTFKSSFQGEELIQRVRHAIAELRFEIPIIAVRVEQKARSHPIPLMYWVYQPLTSSLDEITSWVDESLSIRKGSFTTNDFIVEMNSRRTPYIHSDGSHQSIHIHFLLNPTEGLNAIYFHGPHSIMDARPTFRALDVLLQRIAHPSVKSLTDLAWGEEWIRLPAGPITATGGWLSNKDAGALKLIDEIRTIRADTTIPQSLFPPRNEIERPGETIRVHDILDEASTQAILRVLKGTGFTISHLAEAVMVLAVFIANPPADKDNARFVFDPAIVSQDRYLTPSHQTASHFIAGLSFVPIIIKYRDIPWSKSVRDRLFTIMSIVKSQYDHFTSNPHLPHLQSYQQAHPHLASPRKDNATASQITNLGQVDAFIHDQMDETVSPPRYLIEVEGMSFGHRLPWKKLMHHIWTFKSRMYLQIQASDAWDRDYLSAHLSKLKSLLTEVIPAPAETRPFTPSAYAFTRTTHHDTYENINTSLYGVPHLREHCVLISGASKGIGRAIAHSLVAGGVSKMILTARNLEMLEEVRTSLLTQRAESAFFDIKLEVYVFYMDINDPAAVSQVARRIVEENEMQSINVLVNCAGLVDDPVEISKAQVENWWEPMTTNVRGSFIVTQAFLQLLKAAKPFGQIINLTSAIVRMETMRASGYSLSKMAIQRMTELLDLDLSSHHIDVISVHPGFIPTDSTSGVSTSKSKSVLVDTLALAGDSIAWIAREPRPWLSGRYVSCNWDMMELEQMKDDIVSNSKLKLNMSV